MYMIKYISLLGKDQRPIYNTPDMEDQLYIQIVFENVEFVEGRDKEGSVILTLKKTSFKNMNNEQIRGYGAGCLDKKTIRLYGKTSYSNSQIGIYATRELRRVVSAELVTKTE